jgi:hypothetical protein
MNFEELPTGRRRILSRMRVRRHGGAVFLLWLETV